MPFKTLRQMRFMFSQHPKTARQMANRMKRKRMKFPTKKRPGRKGGKK